MKNYNGFSGEERLLSWQIQKKLRATGVLSWGQLPCQMCGNGGLITPHMENYFNYADFHPLCVPCHMSLHARFSRPMAWIQYLNMLSRGWTPPNFHDVGVYFHSYLNKDFWAFQSNIEPLYPGDKWFEQLSSILSETEKVRGRLMLQLNYPNNLISTQFANIVKSAI